MYAYTYFHDVTFGSIPSLHETLMSLLPSWLRSMQLPSMPDGLARC